MLLKPETKTLLLMRACRIRMEISWTDRVKVEA